MQVNPEVIFLSDQFTDHPYLKCHHGWSNQSTKAFRENNFKILILIGGSDQDFLIPDLGEEAIKVTDLRLDSNAVVSGLEQFTESVNHLSIFDVPKNSIDISVFKKLNFLGITWDKKIVNQINNISNIDALGITSYKPVNLEGLKCRSTLKDLKMLQGNLVTLEGINLDLEELSIIRARNYSDVETINTLHKIRWLECENIKKAQGIVRLGSMKNLTFVSFVDTGCALDFKGLVELQNLEKLWSNGEHVNLNWEELIPLPKLKMVGIFDNDVTDEKIRSIAENSNKKIDKLFRAGTKKRPHIQITFSNPEVKLIPNKSSSASRCECHFGWNDESTRVFKKEEFNTLFLRGEEFHDFSIPDLGVEAKKISNLSIGVFGNVKGLNQFTDSVCELEINTLPKNSIQVNHFKNLQSLSINWDAKIEDQINKITSLKKLRLENYLNNDLSKLNCIANIRELSLSWGTTTNIAGVNPNLESLDLSVLNDYSDVDTINELKNLRTFDCETVGGTHDFIKLKNFEKLVSIRMIDTHMKLDFDGIHNLVNLEKICINVKHINLDWDKLVSLPNIQFIKIYDSDITEAEIISIAEKSDKSIKQVFRTSSEKYSRIEVMFDE